MSFISFYVSLFIFFNFIVTVFIVLFIMLRDISYLIVFHSVCNFSCSFNKFLQTTERFEITFQNSTWAVCEERVKPFSLINWKSFSTGARFDKLPERLNAVRWTVDFKWRHCYTWSFLFAHFGISRLKTVIACAQLKFIL